MCAGIRKAGQLMALGSLIATSKGPKYWLGFRRSEGAHPSQDKLVTVALDGYDEVDQGTGEIVTVPVPTGMAAEGLMVGDAVYLRTRKASRGQRRVVDHSRRLVLRVTPA